jgi:hypothetical protein
MSVYYHAKSFFLPDTIIPDEYIYNSLYLCNYPLSSLDSLHHLVSSPRLPLVNHGEEELQ